MNHDLILTFCDPVSKQNEYDIPFILANNSTSNKWLKILYDDIYIKKNKWNNSRFVGFETNPLCKKQMAKELNHLIDICEKENPGYFNFCAHEDMSQDDFNRMHVWFEKYRGDYLNPHEFFKNGSDKFKKSIERFNELIHMWERIDKQKEGRAFVIFNFYSPIKIELEYEDMKNFELKKENNTLYLEYKMTGKNLVDVWADNDIHVGTDNIHPFKYISSNFSLNTKGWSKETTEKIKKNFDDWFYKNLNHLNSLGFYRDDPKCTIGWIPLAHSLIENTKEIIEPRQFLKRIKIFE